MTHVSRMIALGAAMGMAAGALTAHRAEAQRGNFGAAVAAGSNELFVGEPLNQYDPGAVYIYRPGAGGKWQRVAVLNAPNKANYDHFGQGLAAEGSTLLVSAVPADSGSGMVYVYTRDNSGAWKQTGSISATGAVTTDLYGRALALHGDMALVAAPGSDSTRGAVYVYRKSGSGWNQDGVLKAADGQAKDAFGSAVATDGSRIYVGAPQRDSTRGAVYVFSRSNNGWSQDTVVAARNVDPRTAFGSSILVSDGSVMVGAPGTAGNAGAVYVFHPDSATHQLMLASRLLPFDGAVSLFGSSMDLSGKTLYVGAPLTGRGSGAVYRMEQDAKGDWTSATKIPGPDSVERGQFGGTIAVAGNSMVVGMPGADFGLGRAVLMAHTAGGDWKAAPPVQGETKGLSAITGKKVDCTKGDVSIFGCSNVDLLSFLPLKDIGAKRGIVINDLWGWTDPQSGKEYALIGRIDGTSFIDVSDGSHPRYLGDLPKTAAANNAIWRDIKTYDHYAFIVADGAGPHGMQVFDLNKLRNVTTPKTFTEDAHYDKIHSAHNIVIDTATGFAYTVGNSSGGETCGGGLHMIDIHDPLHPKFAGCFADPAVGRAGTGYIHDAQCTVYHGPDSRYTNHEICMNAAETALSIADVTDKSHPVALAHVAYPNVGYAHQGWLTADQKYFYMDDELDELEGKTDGTRTLIWDVSSLSDPVLAGTYVSKDKATDHNLYIVGNSMYESNYVSGLRVIDISDRLHPTEAGYFDTDPIGPDAPGFAGTWSNYPFFKDGTIVVTSMNEGVFMLQKHQTSMVP